MVTGFGIFAIIIVLLLLSWSLVVFYQKFLENLFYGTFGFDSENTWMSLLIVVILTFIFLLIVWLIKSLGLVPNIDVLIFDYNEDINIGGSMDVRQSRYRRVTGPLSPRGALFSKTRPE